MYLCGEEKMRFIRRQSNKSRNHGAAEYAYERNRYFYIFVTQKSDTTSLPAIACQFVHISFLSFLFTSLHFSCMPNRIFEAHSNNKCFAVELTVGELVFGLFFLSCAAERFPSFVCR